MVLVFHSGAEARIDVFYELAKKGFVVKGILLSFLHGEDVVENKKKELTFLKSKGTIIMLDSGAHAFLYAYFKSRKAEAKGGHEVSKKAEEILEKGQLDNYVRKYINFIKRFKNIFDLYVELDLQPVVGEKKVEEWRQMFFDNGLKPVLVWHGESKEVLLEWIKKTCFIGLGGTGGPQDTDKNKKITISKYIKSINPNIWVHTFAEAGSDILEKPPKSIDSTDSTNWLTASRFGSFWLKQGNKLLQLNHRDSKLQIIQIIKKYKERLESIGINVEKVLAFKDWTEADKVNLYMIEQFSQYPQLEGFDFLPEEGGKILVVGKDGRIQDVSKTRFNAVKHGMYARKLRGLICDNCPIAEKCPNYKENAVCFYEKKWRKWSPLRDRDAVLKAIEKELADMKYRLERAKSFEDVEGGYLDKSVSALQERYIKLLAEYYKLKYPQPIVEVKSQLQQTTINITNISQLIQKLPEKYEKVVRKWAEWRKKLIEGNISYDEKQE